MGKKKNKIPKITEEQYFAYIAGLKNNLPPEREASHSVKPDDGKRNIIVEGGS